MMIDTKTKLAAAEALLSSITLECGKGKCSLTEQGGLCVCNIALWPAVDALRDLIKDSGGSKL